MEKVLKKLANRIKELRKISNLSQEKLAEKADLHPTFIGKIERAEINPSVVCLNKIAKALKVSLSDLLSFPDDSGIVDAKIEDIDNLIRFLKDALDLAKRYKTGKKY